MFFHDLYVSLCSKEKYAVITEYCYIYKLHLTVGCSYNKLILCR